MPARRKLLSSTGWLALCCLTVGVIGLALILLSGCAPPDNRTPGERIAASCQEHYAGDTDAIQGCEIALLSHEIENEDHDKAVAAAKDAGE